MKAIIEIAARDSIFAATLADLEKGGDGDFHLTFESARQLFAELTPARLDLLDTLRRNGPCSVYALAKAADRNYSNVHGDIARLSDLGLVERTEGDLVQVPFDDVEVHFHLTRAA